VGGTRNALALATAAGAEVVNLVSTAYVHGRTEGTLFEEPVGSPPTHNLYERSKIASEALARATRGLLVRILRPGIVVGHSRTLAATTFSGLYGFTRQLLQFRGMMERTQKGLLERRPLRMRVTEDLDASIIPIDEVAAQAVHIGLQGDASGIYHLTQSAPPKVGDCVRRVTRALGFADPELVARDEPLDWLDEQLNARLDFYGAYVAGHRRFDRRRTDAAIGDRADLRRPLPSVSAMVGWYLDRLQADRTALPAGR
jgi:nucleoside-diphosphate-sugar epimerase